jgi:hypothetical protein
MIADLLGQINTSPSLSGADGLTGSDIVDYHSSPQAADFNFVPNSFGWDAAQIQVALTGSFPVISPSGSLTLEDNLSDLQPRNHMYISAGVSNLSLTFPLNSTLLANGFHELTAVAYEGTHVRTQKRLAQNVYVQNGPLSATFTAAPSVTNIPVGATLQFTVTANTNNITKIELFSTGGSIGVSNNQSTVVFSIPAATLDIGLHPFYAIVTASGGAQYRTDTKWFRISATELPFNITITSPPPVLTWTATVGSSYDVLSTTNLLDPFQLRDVVIPTNSIGQWTETNASAATRFYRVRTSN